MELQVENNFVNRRKTRTSIQMTKYPETIYFLIYDQGPRSYFESGWVGGGGGGGLNSDSKWGG